MAPRIVIIGGASLQWVPKLFLDIVNSPSLASSEIVLQDINPEPLPDLADFIRHVSELAGAGITVETTTDRRQALAGADYVVVCISTGGLDSMARDLDVSARFGIPLPIGDTAGHRESHARCATFPCWSKSRARWNGDVPTPGCSTSPTR